MTDAVTGRPVGNAVVWVRNLTAGAQDAPIKHPVTTAVTGDFFRPIVDGRYQIAVEAEGYEPALRFVNVSNHAHQEAQALHIQLKPLQPALEMEQALLPEEQQVLLPEQLEQDEQGVAPEQRLSEQEALELMRLVQAARMQNQGPAFS